MNNIINLINDTENDYWYKKNFMQIQLYFSKVMWLIKYILLKKCQYAFVKHQAVDPKAISYAEKMHQADHLVFIFPIWWELMPAMTKGFIDKVIYPGLTYDYKKNGLSIVSLLPKLQSTTIITTMNTPKVMYKFIYGDALKKALIK